MKFLVISYDDDQQQTFFDWVLADDAQAALKYAGELRPYAVPCDAMDLERVRDMADRMEREPEATFEDGHEDILRESSRVFCVNCSEITDVADVTNDLCPACWKKLTAPSSKTA